MYTITEFKMQAINTSPFIIPHPRRGLNTVKSLTKKRCGQNELGVPIVVNVKMLLFVRPCQAKFVKLYLF